MKYDELQRVIESGIEKNWDEFFRLNCDIAKEPELSGKEFKTSRKIVETLQAKGYEVEYPFDGLETAFRAAYGKGNHKYKVAILAEYDALPDIGHACGHSLSGAISCLAGVALSNLQDELDTDIHIIGTPNEEEDGAKCKMADDGVFDIYDEAIMVHLYNNNVPVPKLYALDSIMYEFHGKPAHSAGNPWDGVNALNAGQLMFHAIDMLRQHVRPDVRMHGIFRNGGTAPNVVPDEVALEIYVRSTDRPYLNEILKKVENCAQAGCLATGATLSRYPTAAPYNNLKINKTGNDALFEVYEELNLKLPKNEKLELMFGSSDIGNVSFRCPAFHPCLKLTPENIEIHSREFAEYVIRDDGKEMLKVGAKIIAFHIAKLFSSEDKVRAMKADFLSE